MFRCTLIAVPLLLTGCAGVFNAAVQNLPSVKDCNHVAYERTGNQVKIVADCQIPMQNNGLLSIPGVP
jgi:hypothetical protein